MTDTTPDTSGRNLRDVRRMQAQERRRLREQRELARERREEVARQSESRIFIRKTNAVVTALVPRISGAIDSWAAKRVPLSVVHPSRGFSAYTDFTTITLNIPALREEQEMTVDFAADLRGLAYHEAGHILVTVPFANLLNAAFPSDNELRRDRAVEALLGLSKNQLHHAWNVLEDQRMESAMVRQSKNLGRYYNVIVLTHVLDGDVRPSAYLLLHGRKHVDADVVSKARAAFVQQYGEDLCVEGEELIDEYKAADDLLDLWYAVIRFAYLTQRMGGEAEGELGSIDEHGEDGPITDEEAQERFGRSHSDEEDEGEDEDAQGQGQGEPGDDEEEGEGEGDGEADGADADQHGPYSVDRDLKGQGDPDAGTIGGDESHNDPHWNRDTVRDAIRKAKEERAHDGTLTGDVRAFNEALSDSKDVLPIRRIPTLANPDPAVTFEAVKLNRGIRTLLEQARAEKAPSWQVGQRRGVLDVIRYRTRQTGDMEYYKDYADGGDMHLPNMSVSLLLDGSGSMLSYGTALAQAAYGVKTACDVVGVPCTVTVYDTTAYLLWGKDDRPLEVPLDVVPGGGTEPKPALDLLEAQTYDKDNHLVIILTDGAWSGRWHKDLSLAHYAVPNRDLVMFFWQCGPGNGPQGLEYCSEARTIMSLDEIPQYLRRYIMRAL